MEISSQAPRLAPDAAWWASRAAVLAVWALAGWPVWRWYVARLRDGSDEPWGLAALLAALAWVPWRRLREPLPLGGAVLAGAALATVLFGYERLPALVRGGLWMVALVALLGGTGPAVARGGLLLLSLPVVATAQFYLGYPLRVVVAACSVPLLRLLGYAVERQGTALHWTGETVLVDAPCSGVQMLWMGAFVACVLAAIHRLGTSGSLRLLRATGGTVGAANVVRCVALFLVEVRGGGVAPGVHTGIGMACFAAALGLVAWTAERLARREARQAEGTLAGVERPGPVPRGVAGWSVPLLGVLLLGVAVRPLLTDAALRAEEPALFPGWPETYEGRVLLPVPLSEREARFAAGFPGRIGAFSDGERTILLRWVPRETRQLHPALHCLRGLGYAVEPGPVWRDAAGRRWGTTVARRDGRTRRVRERISDAAGREWTDVSAWWWDAWRGVSAGPWWAATVFED